VTSEDKTVKEIMAEEVRYGKHNNLKYQVFSVSEQLVKDLHECVILSGGSGSRSVVIDTKDYVYAGHLIKAENKSPLHVLNISSNKSIWLHKDVSIDKFKHDGNIYCLKTTHGSFYMERKGKAFWTGNCDGSPTVSLKNASHVVTALKFQGKDVIGEATIFDDPGPAGTIAGRCLGALIRNNCTVGISSRGYGAVSEGYEGVTVSEYNLVTFDCVHNPSTQKAFIQSVNEGADFKRQLQLALEKEQFINELRADFSSMLNRKQ
jgi:hypothetical protein